MLVKLIDEKTIEYFNGWVKDQNMIYTNESAQEKAKDQGWKELITEEIPVYNSDTHYIDYKYISDGLFIRKVWIPKSHTDHIDKT